MSGEEFISIALEQRLGSVELNIVDTVRRESRQREQQKQRPLG